MCAVAYSAKDVQTRVTIGLRVQVDHSRTPSTIRQFKQRNTGAGLNELPWSLKLFFFMSSF